MSDPVVVIGNGPVVQTTALLLARWGLPVVVLDQRPGRDPVGSRAICQQRDVLDIWASVGAGECIAAEGLTWATARTFHRGTELFATTPADPPGSRFPPFVNLSQSRTEQILDECIASQPLIDVRWRHQVDDLTQDADAVRITCAGDATIRTPYVVVCAGGAHGGVARGPFCSVHGVRSTSSTRPDPDQSADAPRAALPGQCRISPQM